MGPQPPAPQKAPQTSGGRRPVASETRGEQKIRIAIADLAPVLVVDTTSSMGREIADVQTSLVRIIRRAVRLGELTQGRLRRVQASRRCLTIALAEQFRRSSPGPQAPRTVSAIYTGQSLALRPFFERLAAAGRGDLSDHQGQMIESVLLSVLKDA